MAHIERRPDRPKPWRARYRDPGGKERSRSFARKIDAQRWLAEVETSKFEGTWTDPALGRVKLGEWLTEWQRTTMNRRRTTEVRDDSILQVHVRPRFGAVALAAIRQRDVRAWVADLAAIGLAPTTVRKIYQVFSKVMAAAADVGMIANTPCRRIPLPKVEPKEMRFLTSAEVTRLALTIEPAYRSLVLLAAYGGLRIGEWRGCVVATSIYLGELLRLPRSLPNRGERCTSASPRPGPVVAGSVSRVS
jgi:integrase